MLIGAETEAGSDKANSTAEDDCTDKDQSETSGNNEVSPCEGLVDTENQTESDGTTN